MFGLCCEKTCFFLFCFFVCVNNQGTAALYNQRLHYSEISMSIFRNTCLFEKNIGTH